MTFEHDQHSQREGSQVHAEHHHVQAVPPVQEVAPQPLDPHLLTFIPEKSCNRTKSRERRSQIFEPSLRIARKEQRGPTDHPHHVEGAVEDVLLAGGKLVSIQLHRYRLSQQRDEEPQIGGGVEKEFNHRDLQDLSGLVKRWRDSVMRSGI